MYLFLGTFKYLSLHNTRYLHSSMNRALKANAVSFARRNTSHQNVSSPNLGSFFRSICWSSCILLEINIIVLLEWIKFNIFFFYPDPVSVLCEDGDHNISVITSVYFDFGMFHRVIEEVEGRAR